MAIMRFKKCSRWVGIIQGYLHIKLARGSSWNGQQMERLMIRKSLNSNGTQAQLVQEEQLRSVGELYVKRIILRSAQVVGEQ